MIFTLRVYYTNFYYFYFKKKNIKSTLLYSEEFYVLLHTHIFSIFKKYIYIFLIIVVENK